MDESAQRVKRLSFGSGCWMGDRQIELTCYAPRTVLLQNLTLSLCGEGMGSRFSNPKIGGDSMPGYECPLCGLAHYVPEASSGGMSSEGTSRI